MGSPCRSCLVRSKIPRTMKNHESKTGSKNAKLKREIVSSFHLEDKRMPFRVRQNKRVNKMRLVVSPEEGLVIESPSHPDLDRAFRLIKKRQTWLMGALTSVQKKQQKAWDIKRYTQSILVHGREKRIFVRTDQSRDYVLENKNSIFIGFVKKRVLRQEVELALQSWLTEKAKKYFPTRILHLNKKPKFEFGEVFVKNHRTLWGSCSDQGNINLNWRLIMAPRFVSDYILFHEMCHIRCLNHSTRYWNLVSEVCPDYQKAEDWIREYGFLLHINLFNWPTY